MEVRVLVVLPWDFDRSRSSAREEPDRSGARRRSPGPSGPADDDRSSTFESVDFARDDSFRAVLGPHKRVP